jgi:hypothetical protein
MHRESVMDFETLARQELASVLHIFEYWTDGDRSVRTFLETRRDDEEAFAAAHRRVQRAVQVLEPHVSVRAKHVYAPYCIALAGGELAERAITEPRYLRILGLADYARLLHRRALEDTGRR